MKYYLGIDGGGTKTKFTLCDDNGFVAATYRAGTCHYLQCGFEGLSSIIAEGVEAVCNEAEIGLDDLAHVFVGCAGYGDVAEDCTPIKSAIYAVLGPIPHTVDNDCANALAGALAGRPGINIIAGTGSIGYGMNDCGDTLRCGGWHHAIGSDEGSGYWIGWRILKEFMRQSDGRDEKTSLYQAVKDALELASDDQLITRVVEEWKLDRTKIASLSRICVDIYNQDDPYAKQILSDCIEEYMDMVRALAKQLSILPEIGATKTPVSGTGGIFNIGPIITDRFKERLEAEGYEYVEPLLEPDFGSVLLAMMHDKQEITAQIIDNMQA